MSPEQAAEQIIAGNTERGISVSGALVLADAPALLQLPEDLRCGVLFLKNCPGITSLPDSLQAKMLNITGCAALRGLPDGKSWERLILEDCPEFTDLPAGLTIERDLSLTAIGVTTVGDLRAGEVQLEGLLALTRIDDLALGGDIRIGGCPALTEVGKLVCRRLRIEDCPELLHLETPKVAQLTIEGTALSALPGGTYEHFAVRRCPRLTEIGSLVVEGDLILEDCRALTALPKGLKVTGSVYLTGCHGLLALPEGMFVGGTLRMQGCSQLREIHESVEVVGPLTLSDCDALAIMSTAMKARVETNHTLSAEFSAIRSQLEVAPCQGLLALVALETRLEAAGEQAPPEYRDFDRWRITGRYAKQIAEDAASSSDVTAIAEILASCLEWEAIASIGTEESTDVLMEFAENAFEEDCDESASDAILALANVKNADAEAIVEMCAEAIGETDNFIALNAAAVLALRLKLQDLVAPLSERLAQILAGDEDYEFDQATGNLALVLAGLGHTDILDTLKEAATEWREAHGVRLRCAQWLLERNPEPARQLLEDENHLLGLAYLGCVLADLDFKEGRPALQRALGRATREATKLALQEALDRLGKQTAAPEAKDWMIWMMGIKHPYDIALGNGDDNVFEERAETGWGVDRFEADESLAEG